VNTECVAVIELDAMARKSYIANFPNTTTIYHDITEVSSLPDHDIFCAGFPCQPFSLAGNRKGLKDERGTIIENIAELLLESQPKYFVLENVKNLLKTNHGNDFKYITEILKEAGYNVNTSVLGLHTHANIPQCRERLFFVGIRKDLPNTFRFPEAIPLTQTIDDIINRNVRMNDKYYYQSSSQYYDLLNTDIVDDAIYQLRRVYVRRNANNLCPTLTANMGAGGHNVPIIRDAYGIRKLIPEECLAFQGFPSSFKKVVSNTHLYKQAGNSVSPEIVARIINQLI
jgi:DNA (cytosine-5)-methyltransferase 1